MKRLIIITTLLLLTATVWASPAPAVADYCSETVSDTCWPIARNAYMSCMDQGGSYTQCWCREQRAKNACREAFGCPPAQSEQVLLEAGCGPD